MAEPLTICTLGAWVIGGVLGAVSDRVYCRAVGKVQRSFVEGLREPRNHDLARAIRRSQLLALKFVVDAYGKLQHPVWRDLSGYSAEDITRPLTTWIRQAIVWEPHLEAELMALREIDEHSWKRRLGDIEVMIEQVFVEPEPHEGAALNRGKALRAQGELWTLEEVRQVLAQSSSAAPSLDWDRFERLFRGEMVGQADAPAFPGWWRLFRAFMAEEVKADPKVQAILTVQGIAKILELQQDLMSAVEVLQASVHALVDAVRDGMLSLRLAFEQSADREEQVGQALSNIEVIIEPLLDEILEIRMQIDDLPDRIIDRVSQKLHSWFGVIPELGVRNPEAFQARIRERPSDLLDARYGVMPYYDRGLVLVELLAWIHNTALARVAGRLYVGRGGVGKTRLAIEAISRLGSSWKATFLSSRGVRDVRPVTFHELMRDIPTDGGLLLVIDYAESQMSLLNAVTEASNHVEGRVRILALSRTDEEWWKGCYDQMKLSNIFEYRPHSSLEDSLSPEESRDLYLSTVTAFGAAFQKYGIPTVSSGVPDFLSPDAPFGERPLEVAIAAYLALRGGDPNPAALLNGLLADERQHWRRRVAARMGIRQEEILDLDPVLVAMHVLVALVTAARGATREGAMALAALKPTAFSNLQLGLDGIFLLARTLYGVNWTSTQGVVEALGPVQPDIFGEHLRDMILTRDEVLLVEILCIDRPHLFAVDG